MKDEVEKLVSDIMLSVSGIKNRYHNPEIFPPEMNKELDAVFHESSDKLLALQVEAIDDKLKTLAEAVPYLDLCEKDSDRILVWVRNHRWSLIAPKGENTQANLKEDGETK